MTRFPRADAKHVRITVTATYFVVCFVGLFCYTYGSSFCSRSGESGHFAQTFHLALGCTVWEILASLLGAFFARKIGKTWAAPVVGGLFALCGFASIPFWIYNSGKFNFQGTIADVSCFFTEGYGVMFVFWVAPALAVATLVGEIAIQIAGRNMSQSQQL